MTKAKIFKAYNRWHLEMGFWKWYGLDSFEEALRLFVRWWPVYTPNKVSVFAYGERIDIR